MRVDTPDAMEMAGRTLATGLRPGDIICLTGDLGAGKTTFARGILRGLGYQGDVPSPSFAIVQAYEPPALSLPLAHVDLYRIEASSEIAELGLDEWLLDGALIVEWPDHLPPVLRRDALEIALATLADGARSLTATVPDAWEARWPFA